MIKKQLSQLQKYFKINPHTRSPRCEKRDELQIIINNKVDKTLQPLQVWKTKLESHIHFNNLFISGIKVVIILIFCCCVHTK